MRISSPEPSAAAATGAKPPALARLDAAQHAAHHHPMPPDSWIFSEPYAGLQAQARGLAEAAGFAPEMVSLAARNTYRFLPTSLWPRPAGFNLAHPGPALCFTTGGAGGIVGAVLHKRGARVVQVQHPRIDLNKFDIVVANTHDGVSGPNVIISRTALHRVTPEKLVAEKARWEPIFAHLPRPLVAVLVGGSNGRYRLGATEGTALARNLASLMQYDKVGLALTPSRRTASDVRQTLTQTLAPRGAYVWDMQGENPYFGMLACADIIIATIDSISMMSEAVATTAPVLLADLPGSSRRGSRFVQMLLESGRVRQFQSRIEYWPVQRMDDTPATAAELRRRLGLD